MSPFVSLQTAQNINFVFFVCRDIQREETQNERNHIFGGQAEYYGASICEGA